MVRDSNIIMEDLNEARKQSEELYTALIDLGGEMAKDSSQRSTFMQLVHEFIEANTIVKALECELKQAPGDSTC